MSLLGIHALHLRRGERELFNGIDVALQAGELLAIQGPNGVGKTTLLRVLAGLQSIDEGKRSWRGAEFDTLLDEDGQKLLFIGDRPGLSRDLSVAENLAYLAALMAVSEQRVGPAMRALDLEAFAQRPVRKLSTGQIKRTALARLVLAEAEVWLLDEPFNGLDTDNRARLCELIASQLEAGGAVAVASHDPFEVPGARRRDLRLGA